MIFVKVRFYRQDGMYKTATLKFNTPDLEIAADVLEAFRCGMIVSGKGDILWDSVSLVASSESLFDLPKDVEKLKLYLLEHYA